MTSGDPIGRSVKRRSGLGEDAKSGRHIYRCRPRVHPECKRAVGGEREKRAAPGIPPRGFLAHQPSRSRAPGRGACGAPRRAAGARPSPNAGASVRRRPTRKAGDPGFLGIGPPAFSCPRGSVGVSPRSVSSMGLLPHVIRDARHGPVVTSDTPSASTSSPGSGRSRASNRSAWRLLSAKRDLGTGRSDRSGARGQRVELVATCSQR